MKIVFFSSIVWDNYRHYHHELVETLSEKGHSCVFVNPVRYKNWQEGSIRLQSLSSNSWGKVKVVERYFNFPKSFLILLYENFHNLYLVWKFKPDVVVSFDYLMSVLACIYCWIMNIKFVYTVTDDWEELEENFLVKTYLKFSNPFLGRMSFAVTAISHKQAERFKKYNDNVFFIPNGKSMRFVLESARHVGDNILGTNKVNFIGTLRDWYDFELMFEVFREFPQLELNIYGVGELYDDLLRMSKKYSNVFIRGNADVQMLPALVSESLIGILPLKLNKLNDSTSPTKLFDYWAAKKAVIASPTYELKILKEDGGLLLAAFKQDYIDAMKFILKEDAVRESLGGKGYDNILTKYNFDLISSQFEVIFNQSWS